MLLNESSPGKLASSDALFTLLLLVHAIQGSDLFPDFVLESRHPLQVVDRLLHLLLEPEVVVQVMFALLRRCSHGLDVAGVDSIASSCNAVEILTLIDVSKVLALDVESVESPRFFSDRLVPPVASDCSLRVVPLHLLRSGEAGR